MLIVTHLFHVIRKITYNGFKDIFEEKSAETGREGWKEKAGNIQVAYKKIACGITADNQRKNKNAKYNTKNQILLITSLSWQSSKCV